MSNVEEHIVPVRLDLEHDHYRLKDTFLWNCADVVVSPELFAQTVCDDFKLPQQHFASRIVAAIRERVKEYTDQVAPLIPKRAEWGRGTMAADEEEEEAAAPSTSAETPAAEAASSSAMEEID